MDYMNPALYDGSTTTRTILPTSTPRYAVGHPAYTNGGSNAYEPIQSLYGIYSSLWERGCTPIVCAMALTRLRDSGLKSITVRNQSNHVIEVTVLEYHRSIPHTRFANRPY